MNGIQLSPTVQATRSNYSQVHQGKRPNYVEYFADRARGTVLVDQLQTEQGSRFLRKQNRNMLVEATGHVPVLEFQNPCAGQQIAAQPAADGRADVRSTE